jgi:prolyl 4-hydroxylase
MNFILEYENCLSSDICEKIIDLFEQHPEFQNPGTTSLGVNENWKKDTEITLNPDLFIHPEWGDIMKVILSSLSSGLEEYKQKYTITNPDDTKSGIDAVQSWRIDWTYNIQKYKPGEAYYVWHCEAAGKETSNRILAWMFYLNTVTDGGGTEFQFQDYKCKAEQGKLVIWPAAWTHYHRGEVSPTQTKYIITGWGSFV